MFKKLIKIQNVGKFRACCAAGDVQFRKITLFYAENGRGKTTLCDIFRSLQSGTGELIAGRATLGAGTEPTAEILLEGSKTTFKDGSWSANYPNIEVYDSKFIYENVYTGDHVAHEHKKNLYKVIIGEEGVALARKVDELDVKIRNANKNLSAKASVVKQYVPTGMSIEAFRALEKDDEIDQNIAFQQKVVAALQKVAQIVAKPALSKLSLPSLPTGFQELLAKSLEDVSEEAENIIRTHMQTHMQEPKETWLSEGLGLLIDETCPFCGQSLHGNSLLAAYRTYFAATYNKLKADVDIMKSTVASFATEADFLRLKQTILQNQTLCEYWTQFITIDAPSLAMTQIHTPLEELRSTALRYAEDKVAHPLDAVELGEDFAVALESYEDARSLVDEYNSSVEAANKIIQAKKAEATAGDLSKAERELTQLQASQVRHKPNVDKVCEELRQAVAAKKSFEVEKQTAKNDLEQYSITVFPRYQGRINNLLEMFGASFRIKNTRGRYTGGTPSSTYHLVINDEQIELGDANTPLDRPSFKNTLSAGDKSTLALAFFLTQLKHNPTLAQKVVIFDDPFTSQDRSRRTCTQQELCRLSREASQVIVLSHDSSFLKLIWDEFPSAGVKPLQLTRMGPNTTITEWDIEDQVRGDYFQNHAILRKYRDYGEGDSRHVAKTIRPLLEGYLRFKLPGSFGDKDWLGDFIKLIREADPTNPIAAGQVILEDLEDLNNYSKWYHHDQNPSADTQPIDEGELEAYVKRALNLVGGF
ncbi:MAG: AAA family ATPase [Thermodesulfobacteriota bacterium]|nr:AAA family ATPase [Thermodesulfobacteriota bacterium]